MRAAITKLFNALAVLCFLAALFVGYVAITQYFQHQKNVEYNNRICECLTAKTSGNSISKEPCSEYRPDEYYFKRDPGIVHPCDIHKYGSYSEDGLTLAGFLFVTGILLLLLKKFLFVFRKIMTWLFE